MILDAAQFEVLVVYASLHLAILVGLLITQIGRR